MRIGSREITLTRKGKIVFSGFGIFLVVAGASGYIFFQGRQEAKKNVSFLEQVTSQEAEKKALDVVFEVGKLIDLPQGEVPALATVTGVDKLRSQEFYRQAQDGDKVLIYQKAHMAYLYRPSTKKLISVMPAVFEAEEQEKKAAESQVASASDAALLVSPPSPAEPTGQEYP